MLTNIFLKMLNREASSPGKGAKEIIEHLNLTEGRAVADIGSGGGYFALAFARKVGQGGKVFAVDSKPGYLDFVKRNAKAAGLSNVAVVAAGSNGIPLPEASIDLVFARNVFHHLSDPGRYFQSIRKALKPGGRVVIIDHLPGKGFAFVHLFKHFTPAEGIRKTMESAGYRLSQSFDFLKGQSFSVWKDSSDKSRA